MTSIYVLSKVIKIIKTNMFNHLVKNFLKNIQWGLYGKIIRNPSLPTFPKHLLFICKGNICRSPFAERLARKMILDKEIKGISVESAGFGAINFNYSPTEAVRSALRFGISLEDHCAKALDVSMIERADMILVMEVAHKRHLEMSFPINKENIFLLPLFYSFPINGTSKYVQFNVPDPYGQVEEKYTDCYMQIDHCLNELFSSIYK
jgi:protein-tyrosine phosphatase